MKNSYRYTCRQTQKSQKSDSAPTQTKRHQRNKYTDNFNIVMTLQSQTEAEELEISLAGKKVRLALERRGSEPNEIWLLLPALSTVSSQSEWDTLADNIDRKAQLLSFDWPGFGESDRPAINYDASTLSIALNAVLDYLVSNGTTQINVMAAGHSASIALGLAEERSKQWKQLVLVAPTWRGPLPTMTGWNPERFHWLRQLVSLPVIGSLLYRLNTSRAVLKLMLSRHVWVNPEMLSPAQVREQQRLSRRKGARFASVSFVSGGFDPATHSDWWLDKAEKLHCPLHVVLAEQAPPRSKGEMRELASKADRVSVIKGRLGLHQEFGAELAALISH